MQTTVIRTQPTQELAVENRVVRTWNSARIVYFILDVLLAVLAIRFLLKLFAANPASPFANFMYGLTAPFVAPFRGLFATTGTQPGVIEWHTLVAMAVYALIAYAIVRLIRISNRV